MRARRKTSKKAKPIREGRKSPVRTKMQIGMKGKFIPEGAEKAALMREEPMRNMHKHLISRRPFPDSSMTEKRMRVKALNVILSPLLFWGVTKREARQTATAWMATSVERTKKRWTSRKRAPNVNPVGILRTVMNGGDLKEYSVEILEDAIFAVFRDDIKNLAAAVQGCPPVYKRFEDDSTAFWMRLAEYTRQRRAGIEWVNRQPAWVLYAVKNWLGGRELLASYPPVCLWADSAIQSICQDAPEETNSIRKKLIRDCKLYRPKGIAYHFHKGKWSRCARTAWTVTN